MKALRKLENGSTLELSGAVEGLGLRLFRSRLVKVQGCVLGGLGLPAL